jgi:hypothetical protein
MAELLLHPKQDMVSLDGHRFKVVVAGRRWGKCLASGTLVSMADGREIPVESVKAGDLVLTVNQDTYALEPRQVQHLHNNGVRETVRVKTAARQIQCTPNHPLMINNGWVNAGDIRPGDLVAVPKYKQVGPVAYLPISYDDFLKRLGCKQIQSDDGAIRYSGIFELPEPLQRHLKRWRKQSRKRISEYRFKALRDFSDGYFDPIADGDIAWEEVTSVELAEPVQTWDLTVEGNHNFVAEGMITHNTRLALSELIKQAAGGPKRKVWYISPSYKMSKQIMWDDLIDSIPRRWISKIHHTEMWIKLINRSVIELKGADNPDSLRGVGLFYVVMDEFQDIKSDTWTKVIRPTLAKDRGRALFIGTPRGYANLYDVYKLGQDKNKAQWASWQFPTISSPFIPVEEIEAAREDMDQKSFAQEFEASFESMSGRVYHAFDRNTHVGEYPFNPKLPIWVGQDFNVDPMSSAILQPQPNGDIWAVDEIVLRNSSTSETCDELERRFWRHTDAMTIYPDPAGGNRSSARGESDLDIFREKGFKRLKFKRKHPAVADRINSVNRQLMTASGRIRFYVNESCRETIKGLEETLYKSGSREVDKGPGVEHVIDGIGYCIDIERPMRKIEVMGVSI